MKLCLVGDLHLRAKAPRRRKESDFGTLCLSKLEQVLNIAWDHDCQAIIQAGDFFDRHDPSKALLADVIRLILKEKQERGFDIPIYAIHGQHDMVGHSLASRDRSALRVMEAAGAVVLLNGNNRKEDLYKTGRDWPSVSITGISFGEGTWPINLRKKGDDSFSVFVEHIMVGDKPLWPGHELTGPEAYAKKRAGYDLYLAGDYHYAWSKQLDNGAWAINAGCLLRLTADERDRTRRPKVVIFDTETRQPEDVYLNVESWEDVFDMTGYDDKPDDPARFDQMAERLRRGGQIGVSFDENLQAYYNQNDTPEKVRSLIAEPV